MLGDQEVDWRYGADTGLSLLHLAARALKPHWLLNIIRMCPELANCQTPLHTTPGGWAGCALASASFNSNDPEQDMALPGHEAQPYLHCGPQVGG